MSSVPRDYDASQTNGAASLTAGGLSEPTGRYLVLLADNVLGDEAASRAALESVAGVSSVASASDFADGAVNMAQVDAADALLLPNLGVAVVPSEPDRLVSFTAAAREDARIVFIEPEQTLHALAQPGVLEEEYLRGFRDAATELYERVNGSSKGAAYAAEVAAQFVDTTTHTWGLQASRVATSGRSGQGVKIAILDTGLDLLHPDFAGRSIASRSFVSNEAVQDGNGHGTHCTGTAAGPLRPPDGSRRYGCAHQAEIFIGKVLSNRGSGADGQILAGMDWAITNGCRVISMSLGAAVSQVSPLYEAVGQRALAAGSLIVAAAGNEARRSRGEFAFVGRPANSPSIMAVGAVDNQLGIADFSCRSNPVVGGQVDIVGPGVAVHSSWPMPTRTGSIAGTSMATPHVAGIAAMTVQATDATGTALWGLLALAAQRLPLPSVDVGAGLVQAPQ